MGKNSLDNIEFKDRKILGGNVMVWEKRLIFMRKIDVYLST